MRVIKNRVAELAAIKSRREGRSLSQRLMAEESGVPFSTLARWHRNEVTRLDDHVILAFMEYFGVRLEELLVIEEVEDSPDGGNAQTPLVAA